mmetsp:Transcript_6768/g.12752  ORF Transcript_6768/g.12752 Transcript_6768/m.12752 type:complete len:215 (+) Transcript_6768:67-711(+)
MAIYTFAFLTLVFIKDQGTVGSSKSKTVGHGTSECSFLLLEEDVHSFSLIYKILNICRFCHEIIIHHENGIDGLVYTSSSKSVSRKTLCRSYTGLVPLFIKSPLDGSKFHHISDRCRSSVSIDVFHGFLTISCVCFLHGDLHASFSSYSRGSHHIIPIRVGSVSYQLSVNLRSSSLGMLEFLKNDNSTTTCNDESITVLIKSTRCGFGCIIVGC